MSQLAETAVSVLADCGKDEIHRTANLMLAIGHVGRMLKYNVGLQPATNVLLALEAHQDLIDAQEPWLRIKANALLKKLRKHISRGRF